MAPDAVEYATDVTPEQVERFKANQRRVAKAAGRLFAMEWKCRRPACDGEPHEGLPKKHARGPRHRSPQVIEESVWEGKQTALLEGGRGSGKTQAGSWNFAQMVLDYSEGPDDEWGVITRTFQQGRAVAMEGQSGLIPTLGGVGGPLIPKRGWSRTEGRLELVNGAVIWLDSANDGGIRIQGKNLKGAWVEEPGLWIKWQRAWNESLAFALRKYPARIIATGTPKRLGLSKVLHNDPATWRVRLLTLDNISNLAEERVRYLIDRWAGTTLGRQELEGILVDEVEGSLWTRALLEAHRVEYHNPAYWGRSIVALDPSDGTTESDEEGIAIVRHSPEDGHLYVVHSDGVRLGAWDYLCHAVDLAIQHSSEGRPAELVLERNHGGKYLLDLVEQVCKSKGVMVPWHEVYASADKRTRAEPVSGLYQQGKVHHIGSWAELEDQMCTWTGKPDPDTGKMAPSPDRMDALVWACTEFLGYGLNQADGQEQGPIPWRQPYTVLGKPEGPPQDSMVVDWNA